MLGIVFGLVAAHGAYLGRRLKELAEAEESAASEEETRALAGRRRALQRTSLRVSVASLLASLVVALLAVWA